MGIISLYLFMLAVLFLWEFFLSYLSRLLAWEESGMILPRGCLILWHKHWNEFTTSSFSVFKGVHWNWGTVMGKMKRNFNKSKTPSVYIFTCGPHKTRVGKHWQQNKVQKSMIQGLCLYHFHMYNKIKWHPF